MPYSWFDPLSEPSNLTRTLSIIHSHEELTSATRRTRSLAADGASPTEPWCQHHRVHLGLHERHELWWVLQELWKELPGVLKNCMQVYLVELVYLPKLIVVTSNINCIALCAVNRFFHWWCGLWKSPEINIPHWLFYSSVNIVRI